MPILILPKYYCVSMENMIQNADYLLYFYAGLL